MLLYLRFIATYCLTTWHSVNTRTVLQTHNNIKMHTVSKFGECSELQVRIAGTHIICRRKSFEAALHRNSVTPPKRAQAENSDNDHDEVALGRLRSAFFCVERRIAEQLDELRCAPQREECEASEDDEATVD